MAQDYIILSPCVPLARGVWTPLIETNDVPLLTLDTLTHCRGRTLMISLVGNSALQMKMSPSGPEAFIRGSDLVSEQG